MHQPYPGANRRGQQAEQFLEGERVRPGGIGDKVFAQTTSRHCLGRQVFGVDGLDLVVARPDTGKTGKRRSVQAMLCSSRSPSPKTRVGLMKAWGIPVALRISSTRPLCCCPAKMSGLTPNPPKDTERELQGGVWPKLVGVEGGRRTVFVAAQGHYDRLRELRCAVWREIRSRELSQTYVARVCGDVGSVAGWPVRPGVEWPAAGFGGFRVRLVVE